MRELLFITSFTFCLALVFFHNPVIDILFSQLFFSVTDQDFFMQKNPMLLIIDQSAYIVALLLLSFNCLSVIKKFFKTHSLNFKLYKKEAFVLLVFLIGSIVLIQGFSKHYFGRARPIQVQEFGGTLEFTPAFQVSKQCKSNCSFVSFHTSIGILMISYAMILTGRKKTLFSILGIFLTLLFGVTRIMQGKHFLSDIIFSICFMLIITHALSLLLKISKYSRKPHTRVIKKAY